MNHPMLPPDYQPEPFLQERNRRQTIAFYLEAMRSDAAVLEDLPPWHAEVRCNNTRYFLSLEGLKPTDQDTTALYDNLARMEARGRQRQEQLS